MLESTKKLRYKVNVTSDFTQSSTFQQATAKQHLPSIKSSPFEFLECPLLQTSSNSNSKSALTHDQVTSVASSVKKVTSTYHYNTNSPYLGTCGSTHLTPINLAFIAKLAIWILW